MSEDAQIADLKEIIFSGMTRIGDGYDDQRFSALEELTARAERYEKALREIKEEADSGVARGGTAISLALSISSHARAALEAPEPGVEE